MRAGIRYLAAGFLACLHACASDERAPARAEDCGFVGESVACACSDGRTGAQVCQVDGTLGACSCTAGAGRGGAAGNGGSAGKGGSSAGTGGRAGRGGGGGAAGSVAHAGEAGTGADGEAGIGGGLGGESGGTPALGGEAGTKHTGGEGGTKHAGGEGGECHAGCEPARECRTGDFEGCVCSGIEAGYRPCTDGEFGECVCPELGGEGGSAGHAGCIAEPEWCDGRDNDCNGLVDDDFACPDPGGVLHTRPYDGAVYLSGGAPGQSCGLERAIQQIWPTFSVNYTAGFDCYAEWFHFRRSDNELFYSAAFAGILHYLPMSPHATVPTLACGYSLRVPFGFDAEDNLYFRCNTSLMRGNEAIVAEDIAEIAGVFDDSRVLVAREQDAPAVFGRVYTYALLDGEGQEIARFPRKGLFTGDLYVLPRATTVDGNTAYFTFLRVYDQVTKELVVYTIDAESRFRLVRRRIVTNEGVAQLVISDGTLFVQEEELVRAYLPDDSERIVWHAREAIYVSAETTAPQLLPGPIEH